MMNQHSIENHHRRMPLEWDTGSRAVDDSEWLEMPLAPPGPGELYNTEIVAIGLFFALTLIANFWMVRN